MTSLNPFGDKLRTLHKMLSLEVTVWHGEDLAVYDVVVVELIMPQTHLD